MGLKLNINCYKIQLLFWKHDETMTHGAYFAINRKLTERNVTLLSHQKSTNLTAGILAQSVYARKISVSHQLTLTVFVLKIKECENCVSMAILRQFTHFPENV